MSEGDQITHPVVYMLVGLPGSGKSTYRNTEEMNHMKYVSSDAYIEKWAAERNKTYNEIFKESASVAATYLNEDVEWLTKRDCSFIWDQTNLTAKVRKKKLAKIPPNYRKVAIVFQTDLVECLKRNAKRYRSIPEEVIVSMHKTFEEPTLDEGFDLIINYQ